MCLLIIIFIILVIFFIICFSTINLKINDFKVNTIKKQYEYCYIIKLKLFNLITLAKLKIDNNKIKKYNKKKWVNKIKLKAIEKILNYRKNIIKINELKELKTLNIKIKKIKLILKIETEDAIFTSYIVAFLSIFIAIIIKSLGEEYKEEKYKYKIIPEYGYKNFLKINLNCIINVKMAHIIKVIFIILQRRRDNENARTPDRRTYDYSHE